METAEMNRILYSQKNCQAVRPNQAVQLTPLARRRTWARFTRKLWPPVYRFANGLPRLSATSFATGVSRLVGGGSQFAGTTLCPRLHRS